MYSLTGPVDKPSVRVPTASSTDTLVTIPPPSTRSTVITKLYLKSGTNTIFDTEETLWAVNLFANDLYLFQPIDLLR